MIFDRWHCRHSGRSRSLDACVMSAKGKLETLNSSSASYNILSRSQSVAFIAVVLLLHYPCESYVNYVGYVCAVFTVCNTISR